MNSLFWEMLASASADKTSVLLFSVVAPLDTAILIHGPTIKAIFLWQVHEKSVLLVLLPVTLLAGYEPELAYWLPLVASFSMYPLLKKDGLCLAYAAVLLLWLTLWPVWQDSLIKQSKV